MSRPSVFLRSSCISLSKALIAASKFLSRTSIPGFLSVKFPWVKLNVNSFSRNSLTATWIRSKHFGQAKQKKENYWKLLKLKVQTVLTQYKKPASVLTNTSYWEVIFIFRTLIALNTKYSWQTFANSFTGTVLMFWAIWMTVAG